MILAARKAARDLRRILEENLGSKKGPGDFVSNADLKAEKIIFEELHTQDLAMALLWKKVALMKAKTKPIIGLSTR